MRKIALGLVAASLFAVPVMAQTPLTFADVDSNGDGRLSYEELQVVWPDLTPEEFAAADVESAGSITPEQLNALQQPVPADAAVPADPTAPVPTPVDPAAVPPGVDALPPTPAAPVDGEVSTPDSLVD